ncbi:hypothetical protein [Ruegeria sp. HKCCA5763]|uniref:sulfotransferase-like domain-containing protein n=1 Tax=Ruegeria sp. HKCCA5763 TaxID=2682987 RepID=UPI00148948D7|nr:hypothetical protein [Ruegeria sp. HKCCA5763]
MIHALWCHPRSVSTAFERIMRERGDLSVLHEPFMYHHYLTTTDRLFPGFSPEPGNPVTYDEIRAMIREAAESAPVFFKDMAYYVADRLPRDAGFAGEMTHAFLVRDPIEAALSYAKRDPKFTRLELGHEAQYRLYTALTELGQNPLVITADQLRTKPQTTLRRYWAHAGLAFLDHAFTWNDVVPDGWGSVQSWHTEVLQSGAIKAPEAIDFQGELDRLGEPYTDTAAHHVPFYERMRDIAESQAHQK